MSLCRSLVRSLIAPAAMALAVASLGSAPSQAEVEALYSDMTTRGLQAEPTKVVGIDTLPSGWSTAGTGTAQRLIASGACDDLIGWDCTDYYLDIQSTAVIGEISGCRFKEIDNSVWVGLMDIDPGAKITLIAWNDFIGAGHLGNVSAAIREGISGSDASATAPEIATIAYNAFYNLPGDQLKLAGSPEVHDNYFDAPINLPSRPPVYDAGTTYNTGDYVYSADSVYVYRSLIDNNTGNALPVGKTDNAAWESIDPHSDTINCYASIGDGAKVYRNFICLSVRYKLWPSEGWAHGVNNGIRSVLNNPENQRHVPHVRIVYSFNIIAGGSDLQSLPVELEDGVDHDNWQADVFTGNWVQPNASGLVFYEGGYTENGNVITGNALDYVPSFIEDPLLAETFTDDADGWDAGRLTCTIAAIGGVGRVTGDGSSFPTKAYHIRTLPGATYTLTARYAGGTNGFGTVFKADTVNAGGVANRVNAMNNQATPGTYSVDFTATAYDTYIHLGTGDVDGEYSDYDDITVQRTRLGPELFSFASSTLQANFSTDADYATDTHVISVTSGTNASFPRLFFSHTAFEANADYQIEAEFDDATNVYQVRFDFAGSGDPLTPVGNSVSGIVTATGGTQLFIFTDGTAGPWDIEILSASIRKVIP